MKVTIEVADMAKDSDDWEEAELSDHHPDVGIVNGIVFLTHDGKTLKLLAEELERALRPFAERQR